MSIVGRSLLFFFLFFIQIHSISAGCLFLFDKILLKGLTRNEQLNPLLNYELRTFDQPTFGVEWELLLKNETDLSDLTMKLFYALKQTAHDPTLEIYDGGIIFFISPHHQHEAASWIIKYEKEAPLVPFPYGYSSVGEINTPILKGFDELNAAGEIIQQIPDNNISIWPLKAGVHTHIGFRNPDSNQLKLIFYIIRGIEDSLFEITSKSLSRGSTFKFSSMSVFDEILFQPQKSFAAISELSQHSFFVRFAPEHQTLEMKIFNSTAHPKAPYYSAQLLLSIMQGVCEKNPNLISFLESSFPKKDLDLYELHKILNFEFLEDKNFLLSLKNEMTTTLY